MPPHDYCNLALILLNEVWLLKRIWCIVFIKFLPTLWFSWIYVNKQTSLFIFGLWLQALITSYLQQRATLVSLFYSMSVSRPVRFLKVPHPGRFWPATLRFLCWASSQKYLLPWRNHMALKITLQKTHTDKRTQMPSALCRRKTA